MSSIVLIPRGTCEVGVVFRSTLKYMTGYFTFSCLGKKKKKFTRVCQCETFITEDFSILRVNKTKKLQAINTNV